jgi:nucleoside-diphosphate-sugar epimerase
VERHGVFVTGGTGYLGQALIPVLLGRGHTVRALARPGSERSLPAGVEVVPGDALRAETFAHTIAPADTVVHLVGTPRPSPLKAAQFQAVDLVSIRATVAAATRSSVRHLM